MRHWFPFLITLLFVSACAPRDSSVALRAENDSLREQIQTLTAQRNDLQRQAESLKWQVDDLTQQQASGSVPPVMSKYVYEALVQYFYVELTQGRKPVEMLEGPVTFGFSAKGHSAPQDSVSVDQIRFDEVIEWVKAHPLSQLQSSEAVLSQPGYQRIDMTFVGGFYVSAVCHEYRLTAFLIADHPIGMT